ncbi:DUF3298 and DUF4163 domain-containing protein [Oscillibacter sp.]|uniref:DUF3298 and DUF4163 domain-containing protein n=1 Tax=Oscillibacter sp. TaxID=1945593 RepID=UPI0026144BF5|nr:DUF3298 and DUF4163 domain-containing protein [Oscillibacter sp.]MDD3347933.1 DUF3298 domain-containing protein [Oscillibacter sp.]
MKKINALLPVLAVILLTACSAEWAADTSSIKNDPPPMAAMQAAPPAREEICYRVETEEISDTVRASDGTELLTYAFHLPKLTALRENGAVIEQARTEQERQALTVAETFNAHFEKWAAAEDLDSVIAAASEDMDWRRETATEWSGGYWLELMTACYQTDNLVSVVGTYSSDTGGAHPNTWCLGWNFDLSSGTFFGPEGLAADGAGFQQAVLEELIRQAEEVAVENNTTPEALFWEDYEEILANWGSYAVSFDENGMTVSFSPYELACYAAGTQTFSVSYDWLVPQLSEHGRQVLGVGEP